jgi:hypothetical protein
MVLLLFLFGCTNSKGQPELQQDTSEIDNSDSGQSQDTAEVLPPIDNDNEVCYLGPHRDNTVCFQTIEWSNNWGEGYLYPEPYQGSDQYIAPTYFLDLEQLSEEIQIAPNFILSEVMQLYKGRYALFMPHVVDKLQQMRDSIGGPLFINSGYRNVTYNASVGGAEHSRHIYGDAIDIDSDSASLLELQQQCEALGASFTSVYESHVHCDWRNHQLEPAFYESNQDKQLDVLSAYDANIISTKNGWIAPAFGFTEGEPMRIWQSFDQAGLLLDTQIGYSFQTQPTATSIRVTIGGLIVREHIL